MRGEREGPPPEQGPILVAGTRPELTLTSRDLGRTGAGLRIDLESAAVDVEIAIGAAAARLRCQCRGGRTSRFSDEPVGTSAS